MLKTESICENRLFLTLYRKGVSAACRSFIIYCRRNNLTGKTKHPNRLGLTVSTKIGNAVKRNRCKRIFREAYRHTEALIPDGWDIVLVARAATPELPLHTVEEDMRYALGRLGVTGGQIPSLNKTSDKVKPDKDNKNQFSAPHDSGQTFHTVKTEEERRDRNK